MVNKKDYYEILGIDENSSQDEIKKSYRMLAKKYHPDKNKGDKKSEEYFKLVNEAYNILSNKDKKNKYDSEKNFYNPFNSNFFKRPEKKAEEININIPLTLEEISTGTRKTFNLKVTDICNQCNGTGANDNKFKNCEECKGDGFKKVTRDFFGTGKIVVLEECKKCHGTGKIIIESCNKCNALGYIYINAERSINIPKGSIGGMIFILSSRGNKKNGYIPGDIIINIEEYIHSYYKRENLHLIGSEQLNFKELCIGTTITINNTLNEKYELNIPSGTQPGKIFRLRGKGIPDINGGAPGDILIKINLEVPKKLSETQLKALDIFYTKEGDI